MFELASRKKFRFPYKGVISVEDLWDLSLDQLNTVFMALNKDVKKSQEESLLSANTAEDVELWTKIDIVKHIFNVKKSEAEARAMEASKAAKKQQILAILEQKQNDSLQNMSEEDLLKMLNEIG